MISVGEFTIRPDSDSGARPSTLFIQKGEDHLALTYHADDTLFARWNSNYGTDDEDFSSISREEREALKVMGTNLPPAMFLEQADADLRQRIAKVGEERLTRIFEKLFKICAREARRFERPAFLRWLPF